MQIWLNHCSLTEITLLISFLWTFHPFPMIEICHFYSLLSISYGRSILPFCINNYLQLLRNSIFSFFFLHFNFILELYQPVCRICLLCRGSVKFHVAIVLIMHGNLGYNLSKTHPSPCSFIDLEDNIVRGATGHTAFLRYQEVRL